MLAIVWIANQSNLFIYFEEFKAYKCYIYLPEYDNMSLLLSMQFNVLELNVLNCVFHNVVENLWVSSQLYCTFWQTNHNVNSQFLFVSFPTYYDLDLFQVNTKFGRVVFTSITYSNDLLKAVTPLRV